MKYLDCIELLNLGLTILKDGQRVQVPVSKMSELLMIVTRVMKRLEGNQDASFTTAALNDLVMALNVAQENKGVKFLNDAMKQSLVDGFRSVKIATCKIAYKHYMVNNFEPTTEVIPLMREVVKYAQ